MSILGGVNIIKHTKKYIDINGNEITKQQAFPSHFGVVKQTNGDESGEGKVGQNKTE